jgi:VWFA-related protein
LAITRRLPGPFTLISVFLLALAAGTVALAQEPASGRIESVDDSNYPEVRAIVTLVDASGRPIIGLGSDDFTVEETGVAAEAVSVETVLDQALGVAVILVVDTSGSMAGAPIAQARTAAQSFIENLADVDEAAVVSFADDVVVDSALTSERAETQAAISGLTALGNTALFSGVVEAINLARDADLPRKAIILLSDGQDFGGASQASRDQSLELAEEARVPIYAIGLGEDIDRPYLEELAGASGGTFIEALAAGSIPEIYDQLSQLLRSQYVVTLQSTAPAEREDRSLLVTVDTPQGAIELNTDYSSNRTILPATIAPTATAAPTAAPSPTSLPAPSSTGADEAVEDSGNNLVLMLLGVVSVAGLGLGVVIYRRSKRRRELEAQIDVMSHRAAEELYQVGVGSTQERPASVTRRIRIIGPNGDESFEIGQQPVTIGSGPNCQVKLEPVAGLAESHARCWLREGTLMLHHLSPGHETLIGGNKVTWVSLARGDEVQIGPYKLRVED